MRSATSIDSHGPIPMPAPTPHASELAALWPLDPAVTFLNHGSYGSAPMAVLSVQAEFRARMEREPVRFFKVDLEKMMDVVRQRVGEFVGCPASDVAPIANATAALCTIFSTIDWRPGDEVLLTDHEYQSGFNELSRMASRTGLKIVKARIPFPVKGPDQVFDAILDCATPRTRLALVSHITTATSLIFPIQRIVAALTERGVETLVDGAHGPGQVPVDIRSIAPAYYVGSFHKWLCSPKGTGFMYVRPDKHRAMRPLFLSSRAAKVRPERALFLRDFDYMGTDDYTGMLSVPAAIDSVGSMISGGWPAVYARNHDLCMAGRTVVCRILGMVPPAPEAMIGSMASLILPEAALEFQGRRTIYDDPMQDALMDRHRIQIPVWRHGDDAAAGESGLRLIRLSAQLYNHLGQYEKLGSALGQELAQEQRLRATA